MSSGTDGGDRGGGDGDAPVTWRLTLEYDGSRFSGWQRQDNARTITGELLRAFETAGAPAREIGGSGRTDAGVHALGQVAHVRFEPQVARSLEAATLADEIGRLLPYGIQVLALEPAAPRFHARHHAVSRSYLYQLSRRPTAFFRDYLWWIKEPLDRAAMEAVAARLAGRHDFRAFAHRVSTGKSSEVEIEEVRVVEAGELILVRVTASHFLWRMVRRLVGTLVEAGAGRLGPGDLDVLLSGRALDSGGPAAWTAPASGLFLERVRYAQDEPLPPLTPVTPLRAP